MPRSPSHGKRCVGARATATSQPSTGMITILANEPMGRFQRIVFVHRVSLAIASFHVETPGKVATAVWPIRTGLQLLSEEKSSARWVPRARPIRPCEGNRRAGKALPHPARNRPRRTRAAAARRDKTPRSQRAPGAARASMKFRERRRGRWSSMRRTLHFLHIRTARIAKARRRDDVRVTHNHNSPLGFAREYLLRHAILGLGISSGSERKMTLSRASGCSARNRFRKGAAISRSAS